MIEVEPLIQSNQTKEPMLIRYQSIAFGFLNRLRFLWTGKLWMRIEYDWEGNPTHVAAGFRKPEDAIRMTTEELRHIQKLINPCPAVQD